MNSIFFKYLNHNSFAIALLKSSSQAGFMTDDYVWITLNPIAGNIMNAALNSIGLASSDPTELLKPYDGIILLNPAWNCTCPDLIPCLVFFFFLRNINTKLCNFFPHTVTGYSPYDQFVAKWSKLPSNMYVASLCCLVAKHPSVNIYQLI